MEMLRSFFGVQVFLIGLLCAGAALAAHGGRWSAHLDVFSHFAPLWLAGALLVALYGLTLADPGSRRGLVVVGALGAALALLLIAPEYLRRMGPRAPADAPGQIKLIQFNAWGIGNRAPRETVAWLVGQRADIIVVQEGAALEAEIVRRGGYHAVSGPASVIIFSKAKPLTAQLTPLPGRRAQPPLARATFAHPNGAFTVIGVHFVWPIYGAFHQAQGRAVSEILRQGPTDRTILTGDFNSTPWSFERRREDAMFRLERRTRALFTWPAGAVAPSTPPLPFPLLPIDHVYAGPGWRTVRVERGPKLGSDHFPVVVILAPSVER